MVQSGGFSLNDLKWNLRNNDGNGGQSLLDSLDRLVKKIDKSEILDEHEEVEQDESEELDNMPMSRSFHFTSEEVYQDENLLSEMKDILGAEQNLANQMLAMAKISSNPQETSSQKFRRFAIKRVAIRQRLTEYTDAYFRVFGYVRVTALPTLTTCCDYHARERLRGVDEAFPLRSCESCPTQELDREANMMLILEEIAGVSLALSYEEQRFLCGLLGLTSFSLSRWLDLKYQRQHVAFVAANLPRKPTPVRFEARMRDKIQTHISPKKPTPNWWPLPIKQVAQNIWGVSKV